MFITCVKKFAKNSLRFFISQIDQGLTDEIHTVVKQSLISLEKILCVLLDHRSDWFYSGDIFVQPTLNDSEDADIPMIDCRRTISSIQLLEEILEQLPSVFENKYWVIQNRYCHFVAAIDYDAIQKIFGHDKALTYKVIWSSIFLFSHKNLIKLLFLFAFRIDSHHKYIKCCETATLVFVMKQPMHSSNCIVCHSLMKAVKIVP